MEYLKVQPDGDYLDATLGGGGHAEAILQILAKGRGRLLAVDRDPQAIEQARKRLAVFGERVAVGEGNMAEAGGGWEASGRRPVAGILADLGVSSLQLEEASRGFSFSLEGPLDMRMGAEGATAEEIVNRTPEQDLANLIFKLGEERHSRRIARAIMKARPIRTTTELAQVVTRAIPSRAGLHHHHPATRTFLALRLAVNQELESLESFLPQAMSVLAPGGRLAVLTFHSLEDRVVKRAFQQFDREGQATILTRHVIRPSEAEVRSNPRARSAKLRAVEKQGN
ncbi:MAG: 16S rRNA (cytosine(1402)-N(4))-methyltransferase RsmH [Acidobacteria bacterium]|nr:16S rRNA (cytosine(1402)-N(4))-methyltransferase RsmH [Acidobacteriota bacterium]